MTSINESTIFEIIPYVGTNLVIFGMTSFQVEGVLGKSDKKSKNPTLEGFDEFWSDIVVGYSESGIVEHIGFGRQMKNVIYNGINLFYIKSSVALRKILEIDPEPLEYLGFLVFFKLGLYLSGFDNDEESDDKAAALFVRGHWDSRKPKMKKFNFSGA